jgi:hypothetical protein
MENPETEETPVRPFRFNPKVVQMAALVLVALALPLTLAIIGFRDIREIRQSAREAEVAAEIPVLRGSLESVVDAQWTPPDLSVGTRKVVREVPDGEACIGVGESVGALAKRLGATVLSPERIEDGGTRWIIQVPAGRVGEFEEGLRGLSFEGVGDAPESGDSLLYEVEIPIRR